LENKVAKKVKKIENQLLKLNLGSGPTKMEGFLSVDVIEFPEVDVVADLTKRFPWEDNTIEEVHCSHTIEHFDAMERIHIVNEIYRILVPGGKATLIAPHWSSCRSYGDPTHKFPPISEFWFYYLSKEWRLGDKEKKVPGNAPHTDATYMKGGFSCNFDFSWGYSLHPTVQMRNQEMQQFMVQFYKEAAQDIMATLIKK
jgi:SAM-dependent methyltransferase